MRTSLLAAMSVAILSTATITNASAQYAAVAQMYGNGVHAFYAGDHTAAREHFSTAINGGSQDPRVYYFRGIVAYAQGSTYEAESDWQQGARLEAEGRTNPLVGRSLIRFQGTGRLILEGIRQKARLERAANQAVRSQQTAPRDNSAVRNRIINPAVTPPLPSVTPSAAADAAPAAPPAAEDPFADNLAEGEASVTKEDALEGSMEDPFADEAAPAAADADTPADDGTADPFAEGGGDAAPVDDADPFAEGAEDPF